MTLAIRRRLRIRQAAQAGSKAVRCPLARIAVLAAMTVACVALASCSSGSTASSTTVSGATTPTTAKPAVALLRVLVTNDDGVGAPGINAAVQALRGLPDTEVTVVAPLTNQSGTGGRITPGTLTVTDAETADGYPAKAVHGYPADTIVWAITDHGVTERPDLVVSGINFGENVGPLADLSGTVGAAREANHLGIPALAVSQGVDNGVQPDFVQGARQLVDWVQAHRSTLLKEGGRSSVGPSGTLNVPTCANGRIRGPVSVPIAISLTGIDLSKVDCTSTSTDPANDVQGFIGGFAVLSPLGTGAAPSSGGP